MPDGWPFCSQMRLVFSCHVLMNAHVIDVETACNKSTVLVVAVKVSTGTRVLVHVSRLQRLESTFMTRVPVHCTSLPENRSINNCTTEVGIKWFMNALMVSLFQP